jgi:predicted molibdopterin-dependent oxidoreductase YjgC
VRGDNAICFTDRSGKALVGTSFGTSLLESGCEFCGACIDVCPVGALVERDHKWEKARRVERTICPHCPVGCQLNLEVDDRGRVIRTVPEFNSPANKGQACYRGKFGLEFVNRTDRLRKPLLRRNGHLEEATWDEALDLITTRLAAYRGDTFALLTSPTSTNEEHYLAQKFARTVMNTNNIDQTSNTRPQLVTGLERSLGYAAGTNSIWELEQAGCILVFNANLTEEHNVVGVPIKRAVKKGTRLVVIDPREVELTRYAHSWLRPVPGTELLLLGGILKSLLAQGLEKGDWLAQRCDDLAALRSALNSLEIDRIVQVTGVSSEAMAEVARMYGAASSGAIVYALDNIPSDLQGDCVRALVHLALVTGNLGRPASGLYPLRQGANEQGAWDVGCLPDRLPGYRWVNDEAARQIVESVWRCPVPNSQGLGLAAALEAAREGRVRAMLVIGDSANFSNGSLGDALAALQKLEFLVVHDTFLSATARLADVVLPRATFAEKDGTYTNLERRVQRLRPVIRPRNTQAQPESWVLGQVARRMKATGFDQATAAEVMDEIASVAPIYAGISYQRLEEEAVTVLRTNPQSPAPTQVLYADKEYRGIQWPCPARGVAGTSVLYADGFPSGKAQPITPQFRGSGVGAQHGVPLQTNPEYPVWFVPGRVLLQSEREINVAKGRLNRIVRDELIELNPADAIRWSIQEGDRVEVQRVVGATGQPAGEFVGLARVVDSIPPGVIASTGLFGQLAVELQASQDVDPMSKIPGLGVSPARVIKLEAGRAQQSADN